MANNNIEKIKLNYFVGAMLAQGGEVNVDTAKITFSPTSALDKAMGATEVEIPLKNIKGIEHKGELVRTFTVKTKDKIHKFEGSQAKKMADLLEKALKDNGLIKKIDVDIIRDTTNIDLKPQTFAGTSCPKCSIPLRSDYAFCPHCATSIKSTCHTCARAIEMDWAVCAYCGSKLAQAKQANG